MTADPAGLGAAGLDAAGLDDADAADAAGGLARRIAADLLPDYPGEGPALVPAAARTALTDAGLLDADLPELARVEIARGLGRRSASAACELLGRELTPADPVVAAALIGAGERALELGWAYAGEREAFGRALAGFQVQRHAFAGAQTDLNAALALARRAVIVADPLDRAGVAWVAADASWAAADLAVQIHGGNGYSDDYPVSAVWRELARLRAALTSGRAPAAP